MNISVDCCKDKFKFFRCEISGENSNKKYRKSLVSYIERWKKEGKM
jgi:hypothetical protein